MTDWIKSVLETFSYPGLVLLLFLENVIPPIPSELIIPLAGFVSTRGELTLPGVIAAGTLGCVLGALLLYRIGAWLGNERLRTWCDRRGHWVGLSREDLDKSDAWFQRHGAKTVFFARVIPGLRSLISVPAGAARMPIGVFILYTTLGSALWTAALAVAGRMLGQNYDEVETVLGPISTAILAGIAAVMVIRIIRRRRRAAA